MTFLLSVRKQMFEHENFDVYDFNDIPLNRDCYLMDEKYIKEYEKSLLVLFGGGDYNNVGLVSFVSANKVYDNSIELSWYLNIFTRFHKVDILLPKEQFVKCVGCWRFDEKPHIFVKSEWLKNIHLRFYSVFGLVDAIDVKKAIQNGELSREKLLLLRDRIDELAKHHPDISFISFADSTLLKSNWTAGYFQSDVEYTYQPEIFIVIVKEFQVIYKETLGLEVYAILTQGSNEYYDDSLLHISETQNHICLNSLGIPFAELMSIEKAARKSIENEVHEPSELYLDEKFYNSLNFDFSFRNKNRGNKKKYESKMTSTDSFYYYDTCQNILNSIKN